jgi:hypothetical protein
VFLKLNTDGITSDRIGKDTFLLQVNKNQIAAQNKQFYFPKNRKKEHRTYID